MAKLTFKDLSFEDKEKEVKVYFLKLFYFNIQKEDLGQISNHIIEKNSITFKDISQKKAERKFYMLLEKGFHELKNSLNNKKTIYIHKNSGIPLIGNVGFGLVDRNTNVIEVKPITGCNLKCIYCSVDEDKRPVDFIIEEEYLAEEFKKLALFKETNDIEAHIASQGEPLFYAPLTDLIRNISKIKQVKIISVDTNGTLLTKQKIDELVKAGLTRFNFSINAIDAKIAEKIAGTPYNIERIKELCRYISTKTNLIITPVLVPGINNDEIPKIIEFAKELKADIGIQNFLTYKMGRNPVKPIDFDKFYGLLKAWQDKYKVKLIKSIEDFNIVKTKQLPRPFRKEEVIEAEIVCPGRLHGEMIAAAKERTISIPDCYKEKGKVRLKITRTKHNIFIGTPV
ncbi:MAG: radical SAM protein [Nanoarchaeota archaeon]|nr:radical SAM protein [Nanoarchaeota archaeon]MBU1945925.1 radical SAM protein [Nanoarchaeota archaeon]